MIPTEIYAQCCIEYTTDEFVWCAKSPFPKLIVFVISCASFDLMKTGTST